MGRSHLHLRQRTRCGCSLQQNAAPHLHLEPGEWQNGAHFGRWAACCFLVLRAVFWGVCLNVLCGEACVLCGEACILCGEGCVSSFAYAVTVWTPFCLIFVRRLPTSAHPVQSITHFHSSLSVKCIVMNERLCKSKYCCYDLCDLCKLYFTPIHDVEMPLLET